jgi:hypothetical protein
MAKATKENLTQPEAISEEPIEANGILLPPEPLGDELAQRVASSVGWEQIVHAYPGFKLTRYGKERAGRIDGEDPVNKKRVKKGSRYVTNEHVCKIDADGFLMYQNMYIFVETVVHYERESRRHYDEEREKLARGVAPQGLTDAQGEAIGVESSIKLTEHEIGVPMRLDPMSAKAPDAEPAPVNPMLSPEQFAQLTEMVKKAAIPSNGSEPAELPTGPVGGAGIATH